jgi:hypothetical protein
VSRPLVRPGPTTSPSGRAWPRIALDALLTGCAVGVILLALALSAAYAAARPVVLDAAGSGSASYGGWSVWSRPLDGGYALVARSPSGVIAPLSLPPSSTRFEAEVGPGKTGEVVVFPRCTATGTGCTIEAVQLGGETASEVALASSPTATLSSAAYWKGELVYVKSEAGHRPELLWQPSPGVAHVEPLPLSTGASSTFAGRFPANTAGTITGVQMVGPTLIAYATSRGNEEFGLASLFLQGLSSHRRVIIDQYASGAGQICAQTIFPSTLAGGWLYAFIRDCSASDYGENEWVRYRLSPRWTVEQMQQSKVSLTQFGDEEFEGAALDGDGVIWSGESGVRLLASVPWEAATYQPVYLCGRRHPVC